MKGDFLFLDIDGCLSLGKYAPFDVAALQALAALAQNAETEVVLCTGRSLSYVEAIAQFVRFGRYAVTDQGALLYVYLEDEVVFAPQLTPPVRERIAALAQYLGAWRSVRGALEDEPRQGGLCVAGGREGQACGRCARGSGGAFADGRL